MTANIDRRFSQHSNGESRTTRPYRPFKLIYHEIVGSRAEARRREIYLKSGIGREFLKSLV